MPIFEAHGRSFNDMVRRHGHLLPVRDYAATCIEVARDSDIYHPAARVAFYRGLSQQGRTSRSVENHMLDVEHLIRALGNNHHDRRPFVASASAHLQFIRITFPLTRAAKQCSTEFAREG